MNALGIGYIKAYISVYASTYIMFITLFVDKNKGHFNFAHAYPIKSTLMLGVYVCGNVGHGCWHVLSGSIFIHWIVVHSRCLFPHERSKLRITLHFNRCYFIRDRLS